MNLTYNTIVVLCGAGLLGAVAGMVGSLAVLRGRALVGDALAHAALPGLCLAFLAVGYRSLPAMLLGALMSGLAGVSVIALLRRWTRIKEDAAVGIVLSVFFGVGISLSRLIQNRATAGSKAGLDSFILGKTAGMVAADVYLIAGVAAVCLLIVALLYKELRLLIFDPEFARAQGWPVVRLDLALMALVALTVVIGLPAVGVVLVAALLILPGAAARFWTERLSRMLGLSAGFGLAVGVIGTLVSASASKLPAGPVIVLVGTTLFLASAVLAPRRGLVTRWLDERRDAYERQRRRMLQLLSDRPAGISPEALGELRSWPTRLVAQLLADLTRRGAVRQVHAAVQLTAAGAAEAQALTHGSRLWDVFLTRYPELASSMANLDRVSPAELLPAETTRELEELLAASSASEQRDGRSQFDRMARGKPCGEDRP